MLFTGDFIDAKYAKNRAYKSYCFKDNLDDKINEIAEKITAKPFKTISLGKEVLQTIPDNLQSAYDIAAKKWLVI